MAQQLSVSAFYYTNSPTGGACYGDTATLVDSIFGIGPFERLWSPGHLVSDSTAANPTVIISNTLDTIGLRVVDLGVSPPDTAYTTVYFQFPQQMVAAYQVRDADCSGASSGFIISTVTGGYAPYTYTWSNGANTSALTAVTAGTYTVTITDSYGCTLSESITVGNSGVNATISQDTCGQGNGSIILSNLGTDVLTFAWAHGPTDSIVTGLTPGTYTVTVTNVTQACTGTATYEVLGICPNISGRIYEDANNNGVFDGADQPLTGVRVVAATGEIAFSGPGGIYNLSLNATGTNNITVVPPTAFSCAGPFNYLLGTPSNGQLPINLVSLNQQITGQDFGLLLPANVQCGDIFGHVWEDLNQNGVQDAGERDLPNEAVYVGADRVFTNSNGDYSASVPYGTAVTISLDTTGTTSYYCNYQNATRTTQVYPAGGQGYTVTLSAANPTSSGNDFGANIIGGVNFDAQMVGLSPYNASIGDTFGVYMDYKRRGTFTDDCYLRVEFDPSYVSYVSSQRPISSQGAGYIEFFYAANDPLTAQCMYLEFALDPATPPGHQLNWIAYFSCGVADACPGNDTIRRTVILPGTPKQGESAEFKGLTWMRSFTTSAFTNGNILATDTTFNYTYQFHNSTGDTVFHVVIKDTVPAEFQVSSVSSPFSNGTFTYCLTPDGEITMEFANVVLTDSAENANSSVLFVTYNAILKPGLAPGTEVKHRAAAYFNYTTTPLLTDYAVNRIVSDTTSGISELPKAWLNVYPNPSAGKVFIQLADAVDTDIRVYTATGQLVVEETLIGNKQHELNLTEYGAGMYFIQVAAGELNQVEKLVITE